MNDRASKALDTVSRELFAARCQINGEWSGSDLTDNLRELERINTLRVEGGLEPITRAEVQAWPDQLIQLPAEVRLDAAEPGAVRPALDFGEVRLTRDQFVRLPEYSMSLPTGTTIGKRWKRVAPADLTPSGWMLGEYYDIGTPGEVGIRWSRILITEGSEL